VTSPDTKRPRPESKRPTEQVKLRLSPSAAAALRAAAAGKERTLSEHVARLVSRREASVPQDAAQVDALCTVARKLDNVLHAVHLIDSNIGKLNGRLKDLFELDYGKALAHQNEINEAIRDVRDLRSSIAPALTEIRDQLDEPGSRLTAILRTIVRKRKRDKG
jgi:uncharacterized protein (DUF1778 family)